MKKTVWLEAKILISTVAAIFIGIIFTQVIYVDVLLGFICIMAIGLIFFSDFLIGYTIKHNHLDLLMDTMPSGFELCVLLDFAGNIDFVKVRKGPLGKREFVRYKKEASITNDGDYQVRCINGTHGFIGHEDYSRNVNLYKAEALGKLKGDDIKEVVGNLELEDDK